MQARLAGQNEEIFICVTDITVVSSGETTIMPANETLRLNAIVLPTNATNKTISWLPENNTGITSIDTNDLILAFSNGFVTAKANASDDSGIYGTTI
ncbi:MAG: hypothetical protein JW973_05930 [Bacteroidales bacterium]|nr:hypothetical protein [Bacteroidales bacterium]